MKDQQKQNYSWLTNTQQMPAAPRVPGRLDNTFTAICALYKARWQVELFFKWIKHLRWVSASSRRLDRTRFI
jgi:hypothetical protein